MPFYPKVQKRLSKLSQDESIRSTTIKLITGALLSAGILIAAHTPSEAKSATTTPTVSSPPTQGSAIVLGPVSGVTKQGNQLLAGHSSHASHASHHSHYSSR